MVDGSMPSARAAWPASRLGDLVESHSSIWSPSTRAVQDIGSMQACDRNGIENSASSTFAADFIAAATSPWPPIVGVPGCSSPCLNAASTVAEEALSFGWLAYVSRTSANALTACQYWSATTTTPCGTDMTSLTPGIVLALASSIAATVEPQAGPCLTAAYSMFGASRSSPKRA